jgi:flagellar basal-body rod modification protein FlgD
MQIPGSLPHAAATSHPNGAADSNGQNSSMITANDFLTLLVTELKNQDPTANTDPNAYVDQLVQVNSLQQLIQINQNTNNAATSSGS